MASNRGANGDRAALAEADFCAFFASLPGAEVVDTLQMLRVLTTVPFAHANPVVCRHLPSGDARDGLIEETRAYYAAHDRPCDWFVIPHTIPTDLGRTLIAHGLVRRGVLPLLAIDLAMLPEAVAIPKDCTIEEVRSAEHWAEWRRTCAMGSGFPAAVAGPLLAALAALPSGPGAALRHYLARLDGMPVATATLFLGGGAADIYFVATLPAARGRGAGMRRADRRSPVVADGPLGLSPHGLHGVLRLGPLRGGIAGRAGM